MLTHRIAAAAAALLAAGAARTDLVAGTARADVAEERGLTPAERHGCKVELTAVEARRRAIARPGASLHHVPELRSEEQALDQCLANVRLHAGRAAEEVEIRAEVERRVTAQTDTPAFRAKVEREIRLARVKAKPVEKLRPDERKLLAQEDLSGRERSWDEHPDVRRIALSASRCSAVRTADAARREIAFIDGYGGDRTRRYLLLTNARRADGIAATRDEELALLGGPAPCSDALVQLLAACLGDGPPPQVCAAEDVAAYLRLAR
jgi:hypothetical protein